MSTGLMNPQEYEDLLKRLRHLRTQEQSTEKTLTEIRIEKATLIKENIDRADHGQKQGIYEAAGVSKSQVAMDMRVKEMLAKVPTSEQLPGHSILQDIAASTVPESIRSQVLATPDITVKEVRELIKEAKGPIILPVSHRVFPIKE